MNKKREREKKEKHITLNLEGTLKIIKSNPYECKCQ